MMPNGGTKAPDDAGIYAFYKIPVGGKKPEVVAMTWICVESSP
jgi:hypothetical protein